MIYREGEQRIQREAVLESVSTRLRLPAERELEAAEAQAMCQMRRRVAFTIYMNSQRSQTYTVEAI